MIIADIIKELETVPKDDLRKAIAGVRDVFRVFPAKLKQQMLGEYSNTEYALLSALRSGNDRAWGVTNLEHQDTKSETILDIYQNTKGI